MNKDILEKLRKEFPTIFTYDETEIMLKEALKQKDQDLIEKIDTEYEKRDDWDAELLYATIIKIIQE